jgi:hypothetical protein
LGERLLSVGEGEEGWDGMVWYGRAEEEFGLVEEAR